MEDLSEVLDQRTNELLRLEKEAEIAQTDRTTEELIRERLNKQVLDLKEDLKTAKEARVENKTKYEETAKDLNTVLKDQTQKLEQAERTTQGLQQEIEEIGEGKNQVTQELSKYEEALKIQKELLDKESTEFSLFKGNSSESVTEMKNQKEAALKERDIAREEN